MGLILLITWVRSLIQELGLKVDWRWTELNGFTNIGENQVITQEEWEDFVYRSDRSQPKSNNKAK